MTTTLIGDWAMTAGAVGCAAGFSTNFVADAWCWNAKTAGIRITVTLETPAARCWVSPVAGLF
jgi:hypothetical protein